MRDAVILVGAFCIMWFSFLIGYGYEKEKALPIIIGISGNILLFTTFILSVI